MTTLLILVLLIILGVLLSNAFVQVPAFHYGVRERFGERIGSAIEEGLVIILPFIDKIKIVSLELREADIKTSFTTLDKLKLTCEGSLQYRPDPEINDTQGKNLFITMSDVIIGDGINDSVEAKLGALGGTLNGEELIKSRHAISDMINCFFRLEEPPHRTHIQNDPSKCGLKNCKFPSSTDKEIDAKDLVAFYNDHWPLVKKLLDGEIKNSSRSQIEKRYGIDIDLFALSDIAFSEDTQASFEKQKQAEARNLAYDTKLSMAKRAIELGASPQLAFNAADMSIDPKITKNVVSIEGDAGVLGALAANLGKGGK
ncbi:MAG: SPFH domain-containing protein [Minisyncoccia bacterium]